MRGHDRVLVNCQVTAQFAFAFQPTDRIFSHTLNLFAFSGWSEFGVMQSRVHESWARTFASSLEDRLRYGPADCFETFPFPSSYERARCPRSHQFQPFTYEFRAVS